MDFSLQDVGRILLSAVVIYISTILFTRLNGLRSYSKMSSYDFAMTVAIGSIIASTIMSKEPRWLEGMVGLGSVFLLQHTAGKLRQHLDWFKNAVDNEPILLMVNGTILDENLKIAKVKRDDLYAKLREANVLKIGQVQAVIMEATGDISVLHASDPLAKIDKEILNGVSQK